ncbi:MAG: response regulator transcription factor [Pseudomonadota bacterium]|nr:MAG: DNA-binding response regulator [Phenylobacterium zucineum]
MLELQLDAVGTVSPVVLVVEDDPSLRTLLVRTLRENGFRVLSAGSGPEMAKCLERSAVDMILLDVMLPGVNGFDLCRSIRQQSDVPIIILSARAEEPDRLIGLELGADDYIQKPFSPRELVARIRATLRRTMGQAGPKAQLTRAQLEFAGWRADPAARELFAPDGAAVELSGAEFDLLMAFLSNPQRVVGRERLLELSRARLSDASDRSIDVLVSRLRRKLSAAGPADGMIRTVRGVGYIFAQPVQFT